MEPTPNPDPPFVPRLSAIEPATPSPAPRWCLPATLLAAGLGLALLVDAAPRGSATYDEVKYLEVAATWCRAGDQSEISRMGSPLLFWKLQQVPVLWLLDRAGY